MKQGKWWKYPDGFLGLYQGTRKMQIADTSADLLTAHTSRQTIFCEISLWLCNACT